MKFVPRCQPHPRENPILVPEDWACKEWLEAQLAGHSVSGRCTSGWTFSAPGFGDWSAGSAFRSSGGRLRNPCNNLRWLRDPVRPPVLVAWRGADVRPGCAGQTVARWLTDLGIRIRGQGESWMGDSNDFNYEEEGIGGRKSPRRRRKRDRRPRGESS